MFTLGIRMYQDPKVAIKPMTILLAKVQRVTKVQAIAARSKRDLVAQRAPDAQDSEYEK